MSDKPKKPLSGFFSFCSNERSKHTGENKLLAKELGARWTALSEDDKEEFNGPYHKAMAIYKEDMVAWNEANPEEEESKSRRKSKGKKEKRSDSDEAVSEKPKKNKPKKGDHDKKKEAASKSKDKKKTEKPKKAPKEDKKVDNKKKSVK